MAGVRLSDYDGVRERIRAFYDRYPRGSIRTELVRLDGGMAVFRAFVYRDAADPHPVSGWAYEPFGDDPEEGGRLVENCEASAIGRALANLNLAGRRRPSREEMEKVVRLRRRQARAS